MTTQMKEAYKSINQTNTKKSEHHENNPIQKGAINLKNPQEK